VLDIPKDRFGEGRRNLTRLLAIGFGCFELVKDESGGDSSKDDEMICVGGKGVEFEGLRHTLNHAVKVVLISTRGDVSIESKDHILK